jgi:ABC-2 type transport system permease protein
VKPSKLLLCAKREYSATVLTKAFFLGAIVFPFVAWGAIIGVTASGVFNEEKPPLEGTLVVVDATEGQPIADAIASAMDPKVREQRADELREELRRQRATNPMLRMLPEDQLDTGIEAAIKMMGLANDLKVTVDIKGADADIETLRERLVAPEGSDNAILAYALIGDASLRLPPPEALFEDAAETLGVELSDDDRSQLGIGQDDAPPGAGLESLRDGRLRVVHRQDLDADYVQLLRRELRSAVEDERYRVAGIDPGIVRQYEAQAPIVDTRMVSEQGDEEDSTAGVQRLIPIAFFMLLYVSVLTGGQYLFLGTLEEKSSRVMEVLLSAVSPLELLVGKLIGQGLVGLTVLCIYLGLGLLAADRFNVLSAVPMEALPGLLPYFLMAYLFFGALFVAVGSAVTEIREASALQAPLVFLIIVIIAILFPIMDNPDAPIARVMSYFPPATPFVMVMRLSQPSHVVPFWEIIATGVVGVLGVLFTIWLAAKIFRVGVLMYGKPPSFGTLLKWIRQS